MDYKYMKVYREEGKTLGIIIYSNHEEGQGSEDLFPTKYEILELGETVGQTVSSWPARLIDGYYPLEQFEKCPPPAAHYIPDGKETKLSNSAECYIYIGPAEDSRIQAGIRSS
jgi:hypothetical protein